MTSKNGFGKSSLFVLSPSGRKIKHRLLVFLPKKISVWRRHCSIGQSCCGMTSKRSINWFLESSSGMKFFQPSVCLTNQNPRLFVSVRQTNQIALFSLVCCFCFVRAFSLQSHTKIRKLLYQIIYFVNKFKVHFSPSLSTPKSQGGNRYDRLYHFQASRIWRVIGSICIECFHSRGQHLCKFIRTKESVCIRKEFNSQRTGLGHQHDRRFIVLGHQYGRRDVMWKHSIESYYSVKLTLSISNGNRTSCRSIRSVIIRVIDKIGGPPNGSPICLITSIITDRIERHEVLLPLNHKFNEISDM